MDILNTIIDSLNNILWSYILIAALIGCAVWFTYKSKFVQFRMIGKMVSLLAEGGSKKISGNKKEADKDGVKHISSFEAFAVSLASRIGTGNLAGVATAIAVGGPGAVFWMWLMALLGAASAFVESTLAQLYKEKGKDSFIGGPAYYMEKGLKKRWMSVLFTILITITFGFALNSVQSNTIGDAFELAFGIEDSTMGIVVSILTLLIIFGGIQRIAKVSSVVVPIMALGYIVIAIFVIGANITKLPMVLDMIISNAFGWEQVAGGGVGAAIMQGMKRGLFSNEAGMGSAPNAAATADTSHPVQQGLIQALGVFTDTLIVCSCTAVIILFSGAPLDGSINGIQLTQHALINEIGSVGGIFIAVALFFFAFSSILGNYYYGEANILYITKNKNVMTIYRILVVAIVYIGSIITLDTAWKMADLTMALMALCNLVAIVLLGKYAFRLLDDYKAQLKSGIKMPKFKKESMPDIADDIECW